MQFNVASLLKEKTGAVREYDIDDDVKIDGENRHVSGRARFDRTHDGVLVRARLLGMAAGECSRCLKPLTFSVPVDFEEEWIPTVDVDTGARVEPPEGEEEAYRITPRHVLELGEAVAQYWSMNVPMAPVCADDCAGLCAVCGQDAGGEGHGCSGEQVDARWAKLAQLKLTG